MSAILTLDLEDEDAREELRKFLNDAAAGSEKGKKTTDGWVFSFVELNQALEVGKKIIGGIKATGEALIGPFKSITMQTADWANNISDLSEATGISVDSLQTWTYAAEQTGISADKVTSSMNFFTRQMSEAVNGNEELAGMFKGWGIELLDSNGILRDSTDVMAEFMDVFSKVPDNSGKNALAMKLFGKSASEIVPLLNLGSEGIASLGAEMDRLQLRVSDYNVKAANEFSENLEKGAALANNLGIKLGSVLMPAFAEASTAALSLAKDGLGAIDWGAVTFGAAEVVRGIGNVSTAVVSLIGAVAELPFYAKTGWNALKTGAIDAAIYIWENERALAEAGSEAQLQATRNIVNLKKQREAIEQNTKQVDDLRKGVKEYTIDSGATFQENAERVAQAVERGASGTRQLKGAVAELKPAVEGASSSLVEMQDGIEVLSGRGRVEVEALGETIESSVGGGAERAAEKVEYLTGTIVRAVGTMQSFGTMPSWAKDQPGDVAQMLAARKGKFYQSGGQVDWSQPFGLMPSEFGGITGGIGQGDGTTGLAAAVQAGVLLPGQASDLIAGRASPFVGQRFNDFQAAMSRSGNAAGAVAPGLQQTARVLDEVITKNVALEQGFQRTAQAAASIGSAAAGGTYRSIEKTQDALNRMRRDGGLR